MGGVPVLREPLAMVADEHDRRPIPVAAGPERVEEPADLRILVADLRVVGVQGGARLLASHSLPQGGRGDAALGDVALQGRVRAVAAAEGRGRREGPVRVVVVYPEEEGTRFQAGQPAQRRIGGLAAAPLGGALVRLLEDLEAHLDPAVPLERCGAHEGRRAIALLPAHRREGPEARRGYEAAPSVHHVGEHSVLQRMGGGEDRNVGGKGRRHRSDGVLEDDGLLGEGVDPRRRVAEVAVGTQMVGPRGVERDEDDVRMARYVDPFPAAREAQTDGQQEQPCLRRGDALHRFRSSSSAR